ncbi:MAG: hypothetical protein K9G70_07460 [Prolixibacteraceae bacterium]|nr:hypothetical protein [Prolixibacteraceae bacterium]
MKTDDFNYFESLVNDSMFAIVDLETTGFSPKRGDKIVEVGIITTDIQGNVIDKYETLINPNREVSASHIHKITAEMVKNAPYIEDVMDDIIFHLNNKTIVGHNLEFDLRFINHELSTYLKKNLAISGFCTMQLSKHLIPDLPARRLETFCDYYDIAEPSAHTALGDCETTVELFNIFKTSIIEELGMDEFVKHFTNPIMITEKASPNNICFKRKDAKQVKEYEANRLYNMIKRLPSNPTDSLPIQKYLNLLDDILADRLITESELEMLKDFIYEFDLSQNQVIDIHNEQLRKLARVYLLDNILTQSEEKDLIKVADLLCVERETLYKIIEFEKAKIAKQQTPENKNTNTDFSGKSVCFTGQLSSKIDGELIERSLAQKLAMERGLIIKSGVSKKLDYLITADPNSLSGKAKKARDYNVKIIAEPVFWNMIGIAVE